MPDSDAPVTIAAVANEFEAQLIVASLAEEGIEAMAFPLGTNVIPMGIPTRPGANRIPVQVRSVDVERAVAIIAALRDGAERGDGIDWDGIDVGERSDQVPLREPGRMPLAAKVAVTIAISLLLASLGIGLVLAFSSPADDAATPAVEVD